jgi:hypothetical protein
MSDESPDDIPENQQALEVSETASRVSKSTYIYNEIDQEIADAYGWTPQQADEARLYL